MAWYGTPQQDFRDALLIQLFSLKKLPAYAKSLLILLAFTHIHPVTWKSVEETWLFRSFQVPGTLQPHHEPLVYLTYISLHQPSLPAPCLLHLYLSSLGDCPFPYDSCQMFVYTSYNLKVWGIIILTPCTRLFWLPLWNVGRFCLRVFPHSLLTNIWLDC